MARTSHLRANPKERQLATEFLTCACAAGALLVVRPATSCSRRSSDFLHSLVHECRNLPYELAQLAPELAQLAYQLEPAFGPVCQSLGHGQWALFAVFVANVLCFLPSQGAWSTWGVSRDKLSHARLLSYQFAHANVPHLSGNMLTLLAVGQEVTESVNCDQLIFLAIYLASGWAGGYCAAMLSDGATVGASGAVSGVIVALSVLRPHSAVHILGDVNASNPLMLLVGTLGADLARGKGISWQAHLGGGAAGGLLAWLFSWL
jgi:membrane associated rhomboid family serine protease